jgi:hypothetical protein
MAGRVGIGPIRRVGEPIPGVQLIDPTLPPGVEEPGRLFPAPSVTMLVTTFTLTDEVGDLSPLPGLARGEIPRHVQLRDASQPTTGQAAVDQENGTVRRQPAPAG